MCETKIETILKRYPTFTTATTLNPWFSTLTICQPQMNFSHTVLHLLSDDHDFCHKIKTKVYEDYM